MLPCEDVQKLIEDHLAGTLDDRRRREVSLHLQSCPDCHRAVEAARLAEMVLREVNTPAPPPNLASEIKNAAQLRLQYRPRPLHERALGSPVFMATCASLLCGAIICLIAILRVGAAGSLEQPPAIVLVQAPASQAVTVPTLPARPSQRRLRPRVVQVARQAVREQPASLATAPRTRPALRPARAVAAVRPVRPAVMATAAPVHSPVASMVTVLPEARVKPAVQRISMPASVVASIRPAAPPDPLATTRLEELHLMDLVAPQPGIRGEFIRTD